MGRINAWILEELQKYFEISSKTSTLKLYFVEYTDFLMKINVIEDTAFNFVLMFLFNIACT